MPETTKTKKKRFGTSAKVAVAAILVLFIVAPVFIVQFVLTPEWIRANVLPEIESAIGRKVDFEDLSLGFRGLSLKKLTVSEDPNFTRADSTKFASLDRLVLGLELMPLLQRKLVIKEIVLGDPVIVVHRDKEGEFNFSSLTLAADGVADPADEADAAGSGAAPEDQDTADDAAGSPLTVVAERIRLQNARVLFVDESGSQGLSQIEVRRLDMTADGASLDEPFTVIASLELLATGIEPSRFDLTADLDPSESFADLTLALDRINVDAWQKLMASAEANEAAEPEETAEGGNSDFGVKAAITMGELIAGGKTISDIAAALDFAGGKLNVSSLKLGVAGGSVQATAKADINGSEPVFEADARIVGLSLANLAEGIDTAPVTGLVGTLGARVQVAGKGTFEADGIADGRLASGDSLKVTDIRLSNAGLRYVADGGGLTLRDVTISSDLFDPTATSVLALKAGIDVPDSHASALDGSVSVSLPSKKIKVKAQLDHLDIDALSAAMAYDDASAGSGSGGSSDEIGPIETGPYDIELILDAGNLVVSGFAASGLHAVAAVGGGRAKLKELRAGVAGGTLTADLDVDLTRKGLGYKGSFGITEAKATTLLDGIWKEAWGILNANMGLRTTINGSGTKFEDIAKSLNADGNLKLDGGSYAGSPLLQTLASFTKVKELASLSLNDAGGDFKVANGKVMIPGMKLGGGQQKITLSGEIGMDGALNLEALVALGPEVASSLSIGDTAASFLKDENGWTKLPIAFGGTLGAPRPSLPKGALQEAAKQKVVEEGTKAVNKLIDEKLKGATGEKVGNVLNALTGGALGKKPAAAPAEGGAAGEDAAREDAAPAAPAAPDPAGALLRGLGGLLQPKAP